MWPNFCILWSDKQRHRCWPQAVGWAGHNSVLNFALLTSWSTVCKGSVQFCHKIQWSMHQILTRMYLTVSVRPSHMESPTELFIKKFFFRCYPIFSHLNLPVEIPPNRYISFQRPTTLPLSPKTTPGDTWTQSLITNFLSFNP